jgi:hypothetical protein
MCILFRLSCRRASRWAIALVVLVFTVGCGEKMATISGVVELDGKPMSLADNVRGTVMFQPASRQGATLNGTIKRSGKFELLSGTESQVSPGVYLATVSATEVLPLKQDSSQPEGRRITPDKYASSSESGLRVVIKPGENHVVLELESEQPTEGESHSGADADDEVQSTSKSDTPVVSDPAVSDKE